MTKKEMCNMDKTWIVSLDGWRAKGKDPSMPNKSQMLVQAHHLRMHDGHLIFVDQEDHIVRAIAPGHWALVCTEDQQEFAIAS